MKDIALILTAEHAGNDVPREYQHLFLGRDRFPPGVSSYPVGSAEYARTFLRRGKPLGTHLGYDAGTRRLASDLGEMLGVEPHIATVTRLVVNANRALDESAFPDRSLSDPDAFSARYTRELPPHEKERIIATFYSPHHDRVRAQVERELEAGRRVVQVGVHSFTPVLRGARRRVAIGVLYDPSRGFEAKVATAWLGSMRSHPAAGRWVIAENAPYPGAGCGVVHERRMQYPADRYCILEVEVRKDILRARPQRVRTLLGETLRDAVGM